MGHQIDLGSRMSRLEKEGERHGTTEQRELGRFIDCNGSSRLVVSQDDLESVASLFGQIVALRRGGRSPRGFGEKDEGVPLDAHVRVVMRTMKQRLASLEAGPCQDAEVVMAKHSLYSICFRELILITDKIDPGLSRSLEHLRDAHDSLLQDVPGIVKRTLDGYKQEMSSLREHKEREAREARELVQAAQALERETVAHHQELRQLHRRLKELEEENASLRNNHAVGRRSLPSRPRTPLRQNDKCGLTVATESARKKPVLDQASAALYDSHGWIEQSMAPERSAVNARTVGFGWDQGGSGAATEGKAVAASAAAVVANGGMRELSLKQLNDLIASVYVSKDKYDLRCASQRLPSQTLARHLEDFLTHRYGLTSMAKAQAAALRRGIDRFRDIDNAVKVFDLTLRNEVDEGFRLEQRNLERAVLDFIRARIRERAMRHDKITKYEDRYGYRRSVGISKVASSNTGRGTSVQGQKGGSEGAGQESGDVRAYSGVVAAAASNANIESLLRSQTRPGARLATADWTAVVRHVYKESTTADAQTAGFLVKEAVSTLREEKRRRGRDQPGSGKGASGMGSEQGQWSVPFGVFLQVLLEYQLHGHLRRLKLFREEFQQVDVDANGTLNPVQFLTLAKRILRRAQRSTLLSQQSPSKTHDPVVSSMSNEASRVHHAMMVISGKERPNVVEQQAVARLRAADPHGFGLITYSQSVLHLAA